MAEISNELFYPNAVPATRPLLERALTADHNLYPDAATMARLRSQGGCRRRCNVNGCDCSISSRTIVIAEGVRAPGQQLGGVQPKSWRKAAMKALGLS